MLKFLRIICIWICCVSCLFGRIQLPAVAAVPFEYFEDHDQLSYDLDTEQSKAKYDTRLLSEQLLKDQSYAAGYDERPSDSDEDVVDEVVDVDDFQPHERAASCYNGGRKYTHGQKVPRQDPCEVCLCMDGEIFCWWEKCANKGKLKHTKFSNPSQESAPRKGSKKAQTTARTTTRLPMQKQKQQQKQQQQYEDDVTEEIPMKHDKQYLKKTQKLHATKMLKKKLYQQEQRLGQQLIEQQQPQQHPHKHEHSPPASSSKILNFPENLPSVLYYDYKTEEHQHHQHQHHQQHLKHQQQLEKQQHHLQLHPYHYGADAVTSSTAATPPATPSPPYLSTGNDNVYDETETDSDILPEPPTKRPKVTAPPATATTSADAALQRASNMTNNSNIDNSASSEHGKSQSDSDSNTNDMSNARRNFPLKVYDGIVEAATPLLLSTPVDESIENDNTNRNSKYARLNIKNNKANPQNVKNYHNNKNSNSNRSAEDQDDAFHRWLTSTETNNRNANNNNNNNNNNKRSHNNSLDETKFESTQTADFENPTGGTNMTSTGAAAAANSANGTNNKAISSQDLRHSQNEGNAFFRSTFNDYSSEFNGSVVNIDILLTAADEHQQQQQQTHHQQQHEEQIQQDSIILEADLISNSSKTKTTAAPTAPIMLGSSNSNTNVPTMSATSPTLADAAVVNKLSSTAVVFASSPASTTTLSPDRQCSVMGTLYKIGDVLPQDTGNCLQCVCIDGSTSDDTPRVTCSPHNCPPLVLPDLFDATGY